MWIVQICQRTNANKFELWFTIMASYDFYFGLLSVSSQVIKLKYRHSRENKNQENILCLKERCELRKGVRRWNGILAGSNENIEVYYRMVFMT